jgi:hypothetical protein
MDRDQHDGSRRKDIHELDRMFRPLLIEHVHRVARRGEREALTLQLKRTK